MRPRIVDERAARHDLPRHFDGGVTGDQAGVQQGGHGEHLLHRAGLVGVGDGPVAEVVRIGIARVVRVEGGHIGQRQHLAGLDGHDDRGAALGIRLGDGIGKFGLGHPLQFGVDGQLERRAVDRLDKCAVPERDRPIGRGLVGLLAVDAAQLGVVQVLQTGGALIVVIDEAQHVGGERPVRVVAHRVGRRIDAVPAAVLQLVGHLLVEGGGNLALDQFVLVRAAIGVAWLAQPLQVVGLAAAQVRRQDAGDRLGCLGGLCLLFGRHVVGIVAVGGDGPRVGDHLEGRLGLGEHLPVAVEDDAAVGLELLGAGELLGSRLGIGGGIDALKQQRAPGGDGEDHGHQDEEERDAPVGGRDGQLPAPASAAGSRAVHRVAPVSWGAADSAAGAAAADVSAADADGSGTGDDDGDEAGVAVATGTMPVSSPPVTSVGAPTT